VKRQRPGQDGGWEDFTGEEEILFDPPTTLADGQVMAASRSP
jgi:hypothetical protein